MLSTDVLTREATREDRSFTVQVRDVALHRALSYVGAESGWSEARNAHQGAVVVTDSVAAAALEAPRNVVLVVEPTPFAATQALNAVVATRHVNAVVGADEPDELASALEGVCSGRVVIPVAVLDRAASMPSLSPRQVQVIAAVIAGRHNAAIAAELNLSPASVKRELADLYRCCRVANRTQLAALGVDLGLRAASGR